MIGCAMCYSERDEFERALRDLEKQHASQDTTYQAVIRQRDQLSVEVR